MLRSKKMLLVLIDRKSKQVEVQFKKNRAAYKIFYELAWRRVCAPVFLQLHGITFRTGANTFHPSSSREGIFLCVSHEDEMRRREPQEVHIAHTHTLIIIKIDIIFQHAEHCLFWELEEARVVSMRDRRRLIISL